MRLLFEAGICRNFELRQGIFSFIYQCDEYPEAGEIVI